MVINYLNVTGQHSIYVESYSKGVRISILKDTTKEGKYVELSRWDAFVTAIKIIKGAIFKV